MRSLRELYARHTGKVSDKWELYLRVYDELLESRRTERCRLLEIGIQNGGSLEIWGQYFKRALQIVGCDIDPRCADLRFDDKRIKVIVGDINRLETLAKISAISDTYDVIIDDGSHVPSDVIASFMHFFPRLAPGGIYIAEDLHCDYYVSHRGGISEPYTSTRFFFCLVQLMHQSYWSGALPPQLLADRFIPEARLSEFLDNHWIDSIAFFDSLVAVRRASAAGRGQLGARVIAGEEALVSGDPILLRQTLTAR